MKLDIVFPIGLLFSILGLIIMLYGLFSDPMLYQRSLGININLWWGLLLFLAGLATILLARKASKNPANTVR
jgi:hypothetical protein